MADLIQKPEKLSLFKHPKVQKAVIEGVIQGKTIGQLARKLAKGDRKRYNRWYMTIVRALNTPEVREVIQEMAKARAFLGLDDAVSGATQRAKRGRMDGVRWIGEVTGFHNPRVQHEHSGDIRITIDMPRPNRELEAPVVDAEVVEADEA